MKRQVKIIVYSGDKDDVKQDSFVIKGRLLGAVTMTEATKIIQNTEVATRVATGPTISLADTLKAISLIEENETTQSEKFARLVVAISAMKTEDNPILLPTLSKQLFCSAPIELISETVNSQNKDLMKATLECKNEGMLILEETISQEE